MRGSIWFSELFIHPDPASTNEPTILPLNASCLPLELSNFQSSNVLYFSNVLGSTTSIRTNEATIKSKAMSDIKAMLPLDAGNLPLMIQCCDSK